MRRMRADPPPMDSEYTLLSGGISGQQNCVNWTFSRSIMNHVRCLEHVFLLPRVWMVASLHHRVIFSSGLTTLMQSGTFLCSWRSCSNRYPSRRAPHCSPTTSSSTARRRQVSAATPTTIPCTPPETKRCPKRAPWTGGGPGRAKCCQRAARLMCGTWIRGECRITTDQRRPCCGRRRLCWDRRPQCRPPKTGSGASGCRSLLGLRALSPRPVRRCPRPPNSTSATAPASVSTPEEPDSRGRGSTRGTRRRPNQQTDTRCPTVTWWTDMWTETWRTVTPNWRRTVFSTGGKSLWSSNGTNHERFEPLYGQPKASMVKINPPFRLDRYKRQSSQVSGGGGGHASRDHILRKQRSAAGGGAFPSNHSDTSEGARSSGPTDMDQWLDNVFDPILDAGGDVDELSDGRSLENRMRGGGDGVPGAASVSAVWSSISTCPCRRTKWAPKKHLTTKRARTVKQQRSDHCWTLLQYDDQNKVQAPFVSTTCLDIHQQKRQPILIFIDFSYVQCTWYEFRTGNQWVVNCVDVSRHLRVSRHVFGRLHFLAATFPPEFPPNKQKIRMKSATEIYIWNLPFREEFIWSHCNSKAKFQTRWIRTSVWKLLRRMIWKPHIGHTWLRPSGSWRVDDCPKIMATIRIQLAVVSVCQTGRLASEVWRLPFAPCDEDVWFQPTPGTQVLATGLLPPASSRGVDVPPTFSSPSSGSIPIGACYFGFYLTAYWALDVSFQPNAPPVDIMRRVGQAEPEKWLTTNNGVASSFAGNLQVVNDATSQLLLQAQQLAAQHVASQAAAQQVAAQQAYLVGFPAPPPSSTHLSSPAILSPLLTTSADPVAFSVSRTEFLWFRFAVVLVWGD